MSRSTRLTLLCRGATLGNRVAAFASDEALEASQEEALRNAAGRLGRADQVYCAPEASTLSIASAVGESSVLAQALRDIDYGRWRGLKLSDVAAAEPQALASWLDDPAAAPHGGESFADAMVRVAAWFETLNGRGGHAVAITHPTIIRLAVLHVLAAPLTSLRRIDIGFLSITRFSNDGTRWTLRQSAEER